MCSLWFHALCPQIKYLSSLLYDPTTVLGKGQGGKYSFTNERKTKKKEAERNTVTTFKNIL